MNPNINHDLGNNDCVNVISSVVANVPLWMGILIMEELCKNGGGSIWEIPVPSPLILL